MKGKRKIGIIIFIILIIIIIAIIIIAKTIDILGLMSVAFENMGNYLAVIECTDKALEKIDRFGYEKKSPGGKGSGKPLYD